MSLSITLTCPGTGKGFYFTNADPFCLKISGLWIDLDILRDRIAAGEDFIGDKIEVWDRCAHVLVYGGVVKSFEATTYPPILSGGGPQGYLEVKIEVYQHQPAASFQKGGLVGRTDPVYETPLDLKPGTKVEMDFEGGESLTGVVDDDGNVSFTKPAECSACWCFRTQGFGRPCASKCPPGED